jgi:hypothetical protein
LWWKAWIKAALQGSRMAASKASAAPLELSEVLSDAGDHIDW